MKRFFHGAAVVLLVFLRTAEGAATFSLDSVGIRLHAAVGSSVLPPALVKLVNNTPATTFNWTAAVDVPWLSVRHAPYIYGTNVAGDSQFMFVAVDVTRLASAEDYTGHVTVSAPGFTTQTFPVYVTMSDVTGLSPYFVDATAPPDGRRSFNSLSALLDSVTLQGGDVVQIKATGTYTDYVEFHGNHSGSPGNPVTIIGVDPARSLWDVHGVPKGSPDYQDINGYGGAWKLGQDSHDIVIKHIEITGLTDLYNAVPGTNNNNRAFFIFGTNITFEDMYVHHNPNGFMSAPPALNTTVQFSEVAFQGLPDGHEHNFYMMGTGTHIRFNYVHDGLYGINYKDRSIADSQGVAVEFAYNHVANDQNDGYELDFSKSHYLPPRAVQNALVVGNLIEKGATSNPGLSILFGGGLEDVEEVGAHGRSGTLQMVNNTVIAVSNQNPFIRLDGDEPVSASLINNIFYNSTRAEVVTATAGSSFSGTNNWFMGGTSLPAGIGDSLFGTDPGFVNAAGHNYSLSSNSVCVEAGSPPPVPVNYQYGPSEMQSTPRVVIGSAIDIGAFEHGLRSTSPCDLNGDGVVNIVDVQLMIDQVMGITPCTNDIDKDGVCNIEDVQRVVNASLTGQCVSP